MEKRGDPINNGGNKGEAYYPGKRERNKTPVGGKHKDQLGKDPHVDQEPRGF